MHKLDAAALIVHGGAGTIGPASERPGRKRAIMNALKAGAMILRNGGSALDAVMASVIVLEDDPLFNAGFGSTLNIDGAVEMDASVMVATPTQGRERDAIARAGAVAAVRRVKNPVTLARAVMERSPHVMMAGAGAEQFASSVGIKLSDPDELISQRARERWRLRWEKLDQGANHGTVGAAAIDARGQLAAATSTGGVPGKMAGRVGDSAIIGAGTFASAWGAASATGHGEAIMMASLCRETVEGFGTASPTRIAQIKIAELIAPQGFEAGIIVVDRNRRVGYAHNAETMEVGIFDSRTGLTHRWAEPMQLLRKPRI